jgi:hypothetical protein
MNSTAELMDKAERGVVTHEELVDVMMNGAAKHGVPTPPRDVLLAQVRERHPTPADVSAFVRGSFKMFSAYMMDNAPGGNA